VRNAFWLTLIAAALAAIVAGYVQGLATTHPPPVAQLRGGAHGADEPAPAALHALQRSAADASVLDAFALDDVAVVRARPVSDGWQREQLVLFVGLCGQSVAAESGFLRLGVPLAFVVDPHARQAAAFAQLVSNAGDPLFVQVSVAPNAAALAAIRRKFGAISGVASRTTAGMAPALAGSGLAFFDERGDATVAAFAQAGVGLVRRDFTADDRSGPGYIDFMLARAATLSRRVGPVVVLVRPLPSTLAALHGFGSEHDVSIVALPAP
jgi:hypothetical protein